MTAPYEIGVSEDQQYVYIRNFTRNISNDLVMDFTHRYMELGEKHNIRRCFMDVRGTSSITGVMGKYQFAYEKADALGLSRDWRLALLKDPGNTSFDFLETVMENTTRTLKIFEDTTQAMTWLLDGTPATQNA